MTPVPPHVEDQTTEDSHNPPYSVVQNSAHPPEYYIPGIDILRSIPREELYVSKEYPLPIIRREEWGAEPPKSVTRHPLPLTHLRLADTESRQCSDKEDCFKLLKELQARDMEAGLPDIQYNFMIDDEGQLYEGRGWDFEADRPEKKCGLDLTKLKGKSVDIAFIGTFDDSMTVEVPDKMLGSAFHFTTWAGRHNLMADFFTVTQLRIPQGMAP